MPPVLHQRRALIRVLARGLVPTALVLVLSLGPSLAPSLALGQQGDWKATERQCLQNCPRMPRFSGIETDAQYQARMQAQAAHDQCRMNCALLVGRTFPKSFKPISRSAREYYERNAR